MIIKMIIMIKRIMCCTIVIIIQITIMIVMKMIIVMIIFLLDTSMISLESPVNKYFMSYALPIHL